MIYNEITPELYRRIRASTDTKRPPTSEYVITSILPNDAIVASVEKYNSRTALFHHNVLVKLNPTAVDMADIVNKGLTGYYVDIYPTRVGTTTAVEARLYLVKKLNPEPVARRRVNSPNVATVVIGSDMRVRRYYSTATIASAR